MGALISFLVFRRGKWREKARHAAENLKNQPVFE